MDVDTRSTAYRVILFFTVGGRLACIGGEGIIIIIIVRLFLTRRNTTKTLQGRAKA